jgi:hypothetical protein
MLGYIAPTISADADNTLAEGMTCTPSNDYMHSMQDESSSDVFTAGCGGIF